MSLGSGRLHPYYQGENRGHEAEETKIHKAWKLSPPTKVTVATMTHMHNGAAQWRKIVRKNSPQEPFDEISIDNAMIKLVWERSGDERE